MLFTPIGGGKTDIKEEQWGSSLLISELAIAVTKIFDFHLTTMGNKKGGRPVPSGAEGTPPFYLSITQSTYTLRLTTHSRHPY